MDDLDKNLIRLLAEDGRLPIGDLAARLEVTAPTVRSRLKNLIGSGLLKISALINPSQTPELITAIIGLKIQSRGKLEKELEILTDMTEVQWVMAVTGQYDVLAEVVVKGGMPDLFRLTAQEIPKIGVVTQTETFVVMKSRDKWVFPPSEDAGW